MPRSAAAARRGPNSNHRQENGLTPPTKRVSKQKSNGHLNGVTSSSGSSTSGSQVDLRSSTDPSSTATAVTSSKTNGTVDGGKGGGGARVNGCDGAKGSHTGSNNDHQEMAYRQHSNGTISSDGLAADHASPRSGKTMAKRPVQSSSINPFSLASTILKSCPMYDTIAILIFLLQLPPMVLTLVQFLFASLTFMPPGGANAGSLTSNFDIFQGPAGTPSLGTMIAMDAFCLLMWGLFMWTWAQNFALDLAHVQVAITLGGGGAGKNGGVNALCVGIVLLLHIIRSKGVQDFVLTHLLSAKLINPDILSRWSHLIPPEFRRAEPQSSPSWIRSLLAIHILAQAGTAMARRSMAQNRSPQPSRPGKRNDAEASAGSQGQIDAAFESAASVAPVSNTDIGIGTATMKENRDRLTSAKKRRRQANQVRSRQPFWAALASTKVTVMREYEHSRAVSKTTRGLPMTEDDLQGITLDDGLVWITSVDSSTIKFAAGDLASSLDDSRAFGGCEDGRMDDDNMEPFYVCVNGAHWAAATINKAHEGLSGSSSVQWRGEISGLAPNCAYTCSFVRSDNEEEICSMSVKTPPPPDAEQVVVPAATPPRPFHRPSSPTTTLKNSIANAEAKLAEKRSRLKKVKNDHKIVVSRVKKEVDNYNHRLSSGNDETRQKQRSLQLERNIRQTEEATAVLEVQLDNMETIPDEEMEQWSSQKAAFEHELELLNTAKEEVMAARTATAGDIASLDADLHSTIQKRERLQSRRTRLNEQYERIISANAQGLNERERRAAEQFAREQEQAKIEANFNEQLANITRSVQEYQMRTNQLWQQASAIEQAIQQQQQEMLMETGPLTPEGNLPGTNPPTDLAKITTASPTNIMITPVNGRSILGVPFPPFRASPLQSTLSPAPAPAPASTSRPASPVQALATQSLYQASPRVNIAPYLAREFSYRDRSSSNRSARSSWYADYDLTDSASRFPHDIFERRSSGSDAKAPSNGSPRYGPVGSPFHRAGSRDSGSNSGSGSGSACDSPRSARVDGF